MGRYGQIGKRWCAHWISTKVRIDWSTDSGDSKGKGVDVAVMGSV